MANISVLVKRVPGDKQGEDIVDVLCTSIAAATERGRNFIESSHTSKIVMSGDGPHKEIISPGKLLDITDAEIGSYKAQVDSVSISVQRGDSEFTFDTALTVERPAT